MAIREAAEAVGSSWGSAARVAPRRARPQWPSWRRVIHAFEIRAPGVAVKVPGIARMVHVRDGDVALESQHSDGPCVETLIPE